MEGSVIREKELPGGYRIHTDRIGSTLYTAADEMVGIYDTREDAELEAYRLFFNQCDVPDPPGGYGYDPVTRTGAQELIDGWEG